MSEPVSIEVLKERFSSEIVNPFGEVLFIPNRLFHRELETVLEAQSRKFFLQL